MFGMNRRIRGIEKIGWIGLTSFIFYWFLSIFTFHWIPWQIFGWVSMGFLIYSFAYFISSLIFMAYKWGDEPLWGKKE
jgi:hypothetical protein